MEVYAMTITKQSAFKRGLAAVLALAMVFSIGLFQTFSFQVNAASLRRQDSCPAA